jgi:hypothetical protein
MSLSGRWRLFRQGGLLRRSRMTESSRALLLSFVAPYPFTSQAVTAINAELRTFALPRLDVRAGLAKAFRDFVLAVRSTRCMQYRFALFAISVVMPRDEVFC